MPPRLLLILLRCLAAVKCKILLCLGKCLPALDLRHISCQHKTQTAEPSMQPKDMTHARSCQGHAQVVQFCYMATAGLTSNAVMSLHGC